MSWEIIQTKKIKCPCGKGEISMDICGDDWGRVEEKTPVIVCKECSKKYEITSEHFSTKPYHDHTVYYCVSKANGEEKTQLDL